MKLGYISLIVVLFCITDIAITSQQPEEKWEWTPDIWLPSTTEQPPTSQLQELDNWDESGEDFDSTIRMQKIREKILNITFKLQHVSKENKKLRDENSLLSSETFNLKSDVKITSHKLEKSCNDEKTKYFEDKINQLNSQSKILNETLDQIQLNITTNLDITGKLLQAFNRFSVGLEGRNKISEAEKMFKYTLKLQQELFGKDSIVAGITQHNYAYILYLLGKYDDSIKEHSELLEHRRKIYGEENKNTLQTMGNLAIVLGSKRQYSEALELNKIIFEKEKKLLGEKDPQTVRTMGNIAAFLGLTGKFNDSIEMYRKITQLETELYDENHPQKLKTAANFAQILSNAGQFNESLDMLKKILNFSKDKLGENDRRTLQVMNNIGVLYFRMREFQKSVDILEPAYEVRKKSLGPNHPDTMNTLTNLSDSLRALARERANKNM